MYTYVSTRSEGKKALNECTPIVEEIAKMLRSKYKMRVQIESIGSKRVNLMTKDNNGVFDVDYNLVLTRCPVELYNRPKKLKDTIRGWLDTIINRDYTNCGKDSTSSLKYIFHKKDGTMKFTMDIGIIVSNGGKKLPLRLIYNKTSNAYIWNEMTMKYETMYQKIKALHKAGKAMKLREKYLDKKNNPKYKDRKSAQILLETVNEMIKK